MEEIITTKKLSDVRLRWLAIAAVSASGSTPAIPACPSVIITYKKICR